MLELRTFESGKGFTKVDYHMHTVFSDGDSEIEEYVQKASELGLEEIAITDHVWRSSDWVDDYVDTIDEIREEYNMTVYAGLEAKVIDREGRVDVSDEDAEKVDFVMGVVHRYRPEAEEPYDDSLNFEPEEAAREEGDLTLEMLKNPKVDVIGHPSRTYYKFHYDEDTPHYPEEYIKEMIESAKKAEKPLEYNARLPRYIREKLLSMYIDHNLGFTIGSDSHNAERLNNLKHDHVAEKLTGGEVSV
jgi:HisJ family histidinol phosphate phosphatase